MKAAQTQKSSLLADGTFFSLGETKIKPYPCLDLTSALRYTLYTHPSMSGSTLPEAFRLVRQSLSARPRVFHDLLRDGIASFSGATSSNTSTGTGTVKGKGKLGAGETIVPEGHPFISAK